MAEIILHDSTTVTLVGLPIGHNCTADLVGMLFAATFHAGGTMVLARTPDPVECFETSLANG